MSYSPWSGAAVFQQIRRELVSTPALRDGGTLILDESADEKAGDESAGVSRQYNGRMGKVDFCRVDTCLIYANLRRRLWTMVDGELFIAQRWFSDEYRARRERTGIPTDRAFATKLDLGLRMIKRCQANGLRFDVVACDSLYGRDRQFRAALHAAGVISAAQVPASTVVRIGEVAGKYVASVPARAVRELARRASTRGRTVELRDSERGVLRVRCALMRTANLRELLRATLPLEQLTPAAATQVVVKQLVQRARATGSRLRKESGATLLNVTLPR